MTPAQYAQVGADVSAAIVARLALAAPLALVLDRDPVNLDEVQWLAALKSTADEDENGDTRTHAWIVTFAATDEPQSNKIKSIEPIFRFNFELFYTHDFGTTIDNSEQRIRAEVLRTQFMIAQTPHLGIGAVSTHRQLRMRLRLARLGGEVIHRGTGTLEAEIQSQYVG